MFFTSEEKNSIFPYTTEDEPRTQVVSGRKAHRCMGHGNTIEYSSHETLSGLDQLQCGFIDVSTSIVDVFTLSAL